MSFIYLPIQYYPNTVLGMNALLSPTIAAPYNGQYNTAIGDSALKKDTTGYQNTAVGHSSLTNNTTGTNNTSVGMASSAFNTTGSGNTAFGAQAYWVGTGDNNTAIGAASFGSLTTGIQNVGLGWNSGSAITTGSSNVVIGYFTGNLGGIDIRTSSNNVVLSDGSGNVRYWYGNVSVQVGSPTYSTTSFYVTSMGTSNSVGNWLTISIGTNASAGGYASIANGYYATASGAGSIAIGSYYNFGFTTASGQNSIAIGDGCQAASAYGIAMGTAARSSEYGKIALATGKFLTSGDAQIGQMILRAQTTGAAATVLTSSSAPAASNNQLNLTSYAAFAFTGTVVARQQGAGGTQSAAWTVQGLIRREAGVATTTLVASTVGVISNVPGWTLALSADTTYGALAVTATGAAATNVQWVCTLQVSECVYA